MKPLPWAGRQRAQVNGTADCRSQSAFPSVRCYIAQVSDYKRVQYFMGSCIKTGIWSWFIFLRYCKVKLNKCWREAQKTLGSETQESLWWSQTQKITRLSNNRIIVLQLNDPKVPIKISDNRMLRFGNGYCSMYAIHNSIIPLILI